tara:strand:- start:183 stop:434 length:252 start_codon:yes stop_codon:yes gene_type:complete
MELQLKVVDDNNGHNVPYIMYFRIDNDKTILDLKNEITNLNILISNKSFTDYNLKIENLTITSNILTLYEAGIKNGSEIFMIY